MYQTPIIINRNRARNLRRQTLGESKASSPLSRYVRKTIKTEERSTDPQCQVTNQRELFVLLLLPAYSNKKDAMNGYNSRGKKVARQAERKDDGRGDREFSKYSLFDCGKYYLTNQFSK